MTAEQDKDGNFCFRWWYKGRFPNGDTMKASSTVVAADASEAIKKIEFAMRILFPTVHWMQGSEIEGKGVTFGPTIQRLKRFPRAKKK